MQTREQRIEARQAMTREQRIGLDVLDKLPIYRTPEMQYIGDGRATKDLYAIELKTSDLIKQAAVEWAKITEPDSVKGMEFWHRAIPQALFDMLLRWDSAAALVAAEAFLKVHGWNVTRPALTNESDAA